MYLLSPAGHGKSPECGLPSEGPGPSCHSDFRSHQLPQWLLVQKKVNWILAMESVRSYLQSKREGQDGGGPACLSCGGRVDLFQQRSGERSGGRQGRGRGCEMLVKGRNFQGEGECVLGV